jgi:hypothetical protein
MNTKTFKEPVTPRKKAQDSMRAAFNYQADETPSEGHTKLDEDQPASFADRVKAGIKKRLGG